MRKFSPQLISFLADAITGGPAIPDNQSPWPYKKGWQIERFFKECGYNFKLGQSSRVPWTIERLEEINKKEGIKKGIVKIIRRLIDIRDWFNKRELLKKLVVELNKFLFYENYQIAFRRSDKKYLLKERGSTSPILNEVLKRDFLKIESVKKDFERALMSAETDPADSITSSCSFIESTCKHILDKLGNPYPKKQTINKLTKEVLKNLSLLPEDVDDQDLRSLLGSLGNVAQSIGALRTKFGDAHGHTDSNRAVEAIHARVAVGAASTLVLFLISEFEKQVSSKFNEKEEEKNDSSGEIDVEDIPF